MLYCSQYLRSHLPMSENQLPSYSDVITQLGCERQPDLPAELHGFMCGVLCGLVDMHSDIGFKTVLARLEEEEIESSKSKTCLATLMLLAAQQLQDADFGFHLLLPDEDAPLKARVTALAAWCQSFLSGIGLSRLSDNVLQNAIIKEAMHDISEIAKTKCSDDISIEESELAYFELAEFIRMAALLIYTQCELDHKKSSNKGGKIVH